MAILRLKHHILSPWPDKWQVIHRSSQQVIFQFILYRLSTSEYLKDTMFGNPAMSGSHQFTMWEHYFTGSIYLILGKYFYSFKTLYLRDRIYQIYKSDKKESINCCPRYKQLNTQMLPLRSYKQSPNMKEKIPLQFKRFKTKSILYCDYSYFNICFFFSWSYFREKSSCLPCIPNNYIFLI